VTTDEETQPRLTIVRWMSRCRPLVDGRYVDYERPTKSHVSLDERRTVCGRTLPASAIVVAKTAEWHQHANCYNCVHRLWDTHGPKGFCHPLDGRDFPPARECPHGRHPRYCVKCFPPASWSCPNECIEPHDPLMAFPRCTTYPQRRKASPGERCPEGTCESKELVLRRANRGLRMDFGDSDSMVCYHCYGKMCLHCQRNAVEAVFTFCGPCAEEEARAPW